MIRQWISKDKAHSAQGMVPEFFFKQDSLCFAIHDHVGPIMFLRLDINGAGAEMHIQFDDDAPRRTAVALVKAFPFVRSSLQKAGARALTFDSSSPALIQFCCRHFGFHSVPDIPTRFILHL